VTYISVIEALADPTRRAMFEHLRRRPRTVGELAEFARIRQPTASQHLNVLRGARLVNERKEGRRRFVSVSHDGLAELRRYVESYWDDVLTAFAAGDPHPPTKASRRKTPRGARS
jgi:DNA-binding transcriptional ArsR family regulator